jgi:hypothetical protein
MNIIIIPYRNRKEHLEIFINSCKMNFEKYLSPFKIIVVEQTSSKLFNRGKLLNIGVFENFNESYNYFLHDVDTIPSELCISTNYIKTLDDNTILGLYNFKDMGTMGGVIKIKGKDFKEINGFPNNIFGWGGEDKALSNRAYFYNKKFIKTVSVEDQNVAKYYNILKSDHDINRGSQQSAKVYNDEYVIFGGLNSQQKEQTILNSGLNNLTYTITNTIFEHAFIKHIIVEL